MGGQCDRNCFIALIKVTGTLVALVMFVAGGVSSARPAPVEVRKEPVRCINTLEDFYGDAGNTFQGALGFVVFQGEVANASVSSYGEAIDDMVVEWREFTLVEDATDCAAGSCATVELTSTNIFAAVTSTGVTVLDASPYGSACSDTGLPCFAGAATDCTTGSCDPAFNDCLLDGDYRDVGYCSCSVPVSEGGRAEGGCGRAQSGSVSCNAYSMSSSARRRRWVGDTPTRSVKRVVKLPRLL